MDIIGSQFLPGCHNVLLLFLLYKKLNAARSTCIISSDI